MPKPPRRGKAKGQRQDEGQEQNYRGNRTSRSSNERARESQIKNTFVTPSNVEENTTFNEDEVPDSKYQRRKIESNWDRFKEIEEERIVQRGGDFEHLLQSSGGSKSHFQFKEEKEWEEDDEDVTFTSCNFLRIDCNSLRANLDAIPLHKRLGISEDVFTPEEIRNFEEIADAKRSELKQRSDTAPESREGPICDSYRAAPSPEDRITSSSDAVELGPSVLKTVTSNLEPVKSLPADLEDELDRLLSLSNNIDQSDQGTSTLDHLGPHSTSLEDLLDIDLHD